MRYASFILVTIFSLSVWAKEGLDSLELAEMALRNRMIESAESRFSTLIEQADDPIQRFQGVLGLARTRLAQDRVGEASALLSELPPAPENRLGHQANLLRADVAILMGNVEQADALLAITPPLSGEWETLRIRLLARKHFVSGEETEGLALLQEAENPLLLMERAELLHRSGKEQEAMDLWTIVSKDPDTGLAAQKALLEMSKFHMAREEWTQASEILDRLIRMGGVREELEAEVYPVLIRSLEHAGAYEKAAAYLRAFEQKISDDSLKGLLQAKRAQNLIRALDLEAADRHLQEWIALRGDQPELAKIQLLLATTYMERGELEVAREAYHRYLSVFTDPMGNLEAEAGLAKVEESLGNTAEAERLYERAWKASLKESAPAPVLLLKWGDMALVRDRMEAAIERFELFLDRYPDHDLAPMAQLQLSTAIADARSVPAALDLLTQLRLKYPDTEYAERALLHRAVLLDRALRLEQALGAYDAYLERHPQGEFAVDAMTDKGIAAYRLGLFDLALMLFREVQETYPTHTRAEQAASLIGWAYYLKGMDAEARRAGEAFLARYPESTFAPEVRFWLAEVSFNQGEFDSDSSDFLKLTREWAPAPLRSKAHYLAGRSLLAAKKLEPALEQFIKARSVDPDAAHAEDALFYTGDALTELGRFDEAILIFDQLIRAYPDSYLVYAARGRMGDCQYTLGEKDPTRYLEALNTYTLVEESQEATLELRIQAMFKIGRTLNALNRGDEARTQFLKMLHLYMQHRGRLGAEASAWFVRGVAETAQSFERKGEYREAIKVYRLLVESGLPQAGVGARRNEDLRREHLILF
ncbi:MAG: tetratricopeptide repeat protein [Kiritimatiellae bacterium]|jgi:TolA-binding protein|nr:tetratricopeptide repeat protein [Kiritimatiellia bacterium]